MPDSLACAGLEEAIFHRKTAGLSPARLIPPLYHPPRLPNRSGKSMLRLVSLGLFALLPASALAQNAPFPFPPLIDMRGTPEDQRACRGDAVKLCKQVLENDQAVLLCFKRNRPQLSAACEATLRKYGQ
jgi:hypothetical protein